MFLVAIFSCHVTLERAIPEVGLALNMALSPLLLVLAGISSASRPTGPGAPKRGLAPLSGDPDLERVRMKGFRSLARVFSVRFRNPRQDIKVCRGLPLRLCRSWAVCSLSHARGLERVYIAFCLSGLRVSKTITTRQTVCGQKKLTLAHALIFKPVLRFSS